MSKLLSERLTSIVPLATPRHFTEMPLIAGSGQPRVILGTMTFGPDASGGARVTDLDTYKKVLDHFQSKGYNEIDTARVYVNGKQEAWTRDAAYKERGLTCATKWYPHEDHAHSAEKIEEILNQSLKELDTQCVDIFYLHAPDRTLPFTTPLKKLDELHKQGKFVQLGLSNFTAAEVAEVVTHCKYSNWVRPTIYQGMYNAIQRSIEPELVATCRRFGIDIVVYNPIAGGIFSGKYKSNEVPKEGRYSDSMSYGKMYRKRYFQDATFDALAMIEPVVQKHNLTLLETAFRWIIHHSALKIKDGNDGIIIGVSSQEQLESNLKDIEKGPLPEEVLNVLDEAWLVTKPTAAHYWHKELKYTYEDPGFTKKIEEDLAALSGVSRK
ncbi:Aldo-keto reductase [Fulvia fulva]|uniref:Aldo-keto reductase n=1 Tax=Passalora fulva TaxID=5499 RepID=A0A9Q8L631_PASFU|nr:Aldo-keto reductase [Fulvia fulva]KAK4634211.1 Aldo-keto reductase [Fulvia fulva]KAK4638627.1 Aldo-keto reductase [Fulvia fulva]UJO11409.1 Aldo-keto reductase [Fulvia fulva]WPV08220.1 Aldo-keto reductase [Fulvia fulva]WPV24697.1 Aldo-keto reductase [Fulvia fulva]